MFLTPYPFLPELRGDHIDRNRFSWIRL